MVDFGLSVSVIQLFTVPSVVALSICAARMHHWLIDHVYGSTETAPDSLHGHSFMVAKVIKTPETRISLGQTKGAVQRAYLQFSKLETSDDGSSTGMNKQVHHEPIQLISDKDPERGAEN
ncbi:hypothetical protein BC826DRAFT_1059816 [Russula brevipes]|nr:hypothetical protein BC826DRAFT_1059816 [Russula brevipes]